MGELNPVIRAKLRQTFLNRCLRITIDGYNLMKEAQDYQIDWEEESLSANLVRHMRCSQETARGKIDIICEHPLYDENIEQGKTQPKAAPRIDIRMASWTSSHQLVYYIEAKNLCQNDWHKSSGATASASHYRRRYIDTGIDNFVTERYPEGCLVGYILEGEIEPIVKSINNLLAKHRNRSSEAIQDKQTIHQHPHCYLSHHQTSNRGELALRHIFMKLN